MSNNRSLKADPKEEAAEDDIPSKEEGKSNVKNEANANVKSEFAGTDEAGNGVIKEATISQVAQD